jgi:hypothetical protein
VKDANELLVAQGPEGFVRTWGRLVSEASARAARLKSTSAPGAAAPVAPPKAAAKEENEPELVRDGEGYALEILSRTWRVKGLSAFGVDRLRVNLRLDEGSRFHVDTFDLYSARSRQGFIEAALKALRLDESEGASIADEIALVIAALERERLSLRRQGKGEAEPAAMSAAEREEALGFLRSPDLIEKLKEDFLVCGCVGEETALLTGYLALISRKLPKPLSVLFCARSGAGKSALQEALCDLVPPEDLIRYTRISGQVLFYKDENALVRKILAVDEEDGATHAAYALRSLLSSGYLSCSVTRTDPRTGRQVDDDRRVNGPTSVFLTSAHPEALDYETRNRFVLLTIDESREQTARILSRQWWDESVEGLIADEKKKAVMRRHHNAQRLIEPLRVVIPFKVGFPSGFLILRREQKKYLTLLKAIALLHQHQRPRKMARAEGGAAVEYIEVTETDVAIARGLAPLILRRNLDELAPPTRALLVELQRLVAAKRKVVSEAPKPREGAIDGVRRYRLTKPDEPDERLLIDRREVQKATGLSYWHLRVYLAQLVEYEYLAQAKGSQGRRALYELLCEESEEEPWPD